MLTLVKNDTLNFITATAAQRQITQTPRIVLGLSGGPDSVFLFYVLAALHTEGHIALVAAHLDHEWRTESAKDAVFCIQLSTKFNIPIIVGKASGLAIAIKANGSQEDVGRRMRRFFLEQTAKQHDAHFIALAHHRQDQQETFFLRLIRGTTIAGLRGMKPIDGLYLRPLLQVNKLEIIAYLEANGQLYCQDPTNTTDTYLRNRIRKYLIPALHQCDSRIDTTFDRTLDLLAAEDDFLQTVTQQAFKDCFTFETKNGGLTGSLAHLAALDPVIQRRVILLWLITENVPFTASASFIQEILRFLQSPAGGRHQVGEHTVIHKQQQQFWVDTLPIHPLR